MSNGQSLEENFILAAGKGDLELIRNCLEEGINIEAKLQWNGNTALLYAASCGEVEVTKFLIAKGANINAKNNSGNTPLHLATESRYKDVVEVLINNGADLNASVVSYKCLYILCHSRLDLESMFAPRISAYAGMTSTSMIRQDIYETLH